MDSSHVLHIQTEKYCIRVHCTVHCKITISHDAAPKVQCTYRLRTNISMYEPTYVLFTKMNRKDCRKIGRAQASTFGLLKQQSTNSRIPVVRLFQIVASHFSNLFSLKSINALSNLCKPKIVKRSKGSFCGHLLLEKVMFISPKPIPTPNKILHKIGS
jgi:hypothetical protein